MADAALSTPAETVAGLMFLSSLGVVAWGIATWRMETVMVGCCLGIASVVVAGIR